MDQVKDHPKCGHIRIPFLKFNRSSINDSGNNNLSTKSYVDSSYHCWFGKDHVKV